MFTAEGITQKRWLTVGGGLVDLPVASVIVAVVSG